MSKRKNLMVSALLSFYLLASAFQILCGFESAVSNGLVEARYYPYSFIYLHAKQYDDNGNFLGCWGTGYDCLVIPFGRNSMTVSTEGLGTQPAQMLNNK